MKYSILHRILKNSIYIEKEDKFDDPLIGYSDHSIGIEACKEAVRRGAKVLEKHYTLSHSLHCKTESAHVCSMVQEELIELRKYCDGLSK